MINGPILLLIGMILVIISFPIYDYIAQKRRDNELNETWQPYDSSDE